MKSFLLPGIAVTLAILGATQAFGGTVDFVTNFNAPNNPNANSGFAYGSGSTPGAFTAFNALAADANCLGALSYCEGFLSASFPNSPGVAWNATGSNIVSGTVNLPINVVHFDPQGQSIDIEYTAAAAGIFTVAATFTGEDSSQHQIFTSVYANGVQQGSTNSISSFGATQTYSFSTTLAIGQKLDFIVTGAGPSWDSGGLSGTITTPGVTGTPEPATMAMLGGGLGVIALYRRRRTGN